MSSRQPSSRKLTNIGTHSRYLHPTSDGCLNVQALGSDRYLSTTQGHGNQAHRPPGQLAHWPGACRSRGARNGAIAPRLLFRAAAKRSFNAPATISAGKGRRIWRLPSHAQTPRRRKFHPSRRPSGDNKTAIRCPSSLYLLVVFNSL